MLGYDFNIEYKKLLENIVAKALLRLPLAMEFELLSAIKGLNISVFVEQICVAHMLNEIRQALIEG